jgi:hypothetical protein
VARKRFQVGETRRATVRLRLKRAARRQLLRNRRLRIRSKIVLTNGFGLKSTARRAITARLPRR